MECNITRVCPFAVTKTISSCTHDVKGTVAKEEEKKEKGRFTTTTTTIVASHAGFRAVVLKPMGDVTSWSSSPPSSAFPMTSEVVVCRPSETRLLIPRPNQIITELLHSRRCLPRLYGLWIMCDEEGLFGFDDDGSFFALSSKMMSSQL